MIVGDSKNISINITENLKPGEKLNCYLPANDFEKGINTILASEIPSLNDKYSDNPAYKVRAQTPGEMFRSIVLDIYKWGEENGHKIINIVNFNTSGGFELVVVYE